MRTYLRVLRIAWRAALRELDSFFERRMAENRPLFEAGLALTTLGLGNAALWLIENSPRSN